MLDWIPSVENLESYQNGLSCSYDMCGKRINSSVCRGLVVARVQMPPDLSTAVGWALRCDVGDLSTSSGS